MLLRTKHGVSPCCHPRKPTNRSQNSSETLRCCKDPSVPRDYGARLVSRTETPLAAHILIVRKLISRIIEHQKTRTQNSSRRCANTSRYKYLKHKAPGMPLSTGYMIKIKQFMPVSDMYMLIYLKYARAYALLKKAFCYAQKGQICLKLCGHYGPMSLMTNDLLVVKKGFNNYYVACLDFKNMSNLSSHSAAC